MFTANVLCLKKKKKRTYCLNTSDGNLKKNEAGTSKNDRGRRSTVTMMQITEDTPPDMLAGAMDLTVHLPSGKVVKMSVERSTPMMDLLVQITTANQLQLSTHTLQVLGMAPSSQHSDKILPFKPNTPIGTLDTQHIRVLPKERTLPAPKYAAPGHQPFESTFRLKVHLPRNQLYVTRVSRHVLLEDIMKKVCEEKNLDPMKYDFKHPGNLDEVLNPKLTLSDYQITEIYVVAKGTTNLNQAFSAADIMVLRKEEERKQMHNKTGGGVFNLIFKRGKSSMGSGSVSSDNRSISPTHSDDSRSLTPPAMQAPPIVTPPKNKDPPPDRPKPPQRKRRPAPKPPQIQIGHASNENDEEKSSVVSNEVVESSKKSSDNGLTICHSRNSSDSSGYHEASILSDHCANNNNNASLPRSRPKSAFVGDLSTLQSTSNLTKMATHSRSTTSLVPGRKKKTAPPPPPVAVSPSSSVVVNHSEKPSPLVASQAPPITIQTSEFPEVLDTAIQTNPLVPIPKPRNKLSRPLSLSEDKTKRSFNIAIKEQIEKEIEEKLGITDSNEKEELNNKKIEFQLNNDTSLKQDNDYSMEEILSSLEAVKPFIMKSSESKSLVSNLQKSLANNTFDSEDSKPPSIVGVIPKTSRSSLNENDISDRSAEAFNYNSEAIGRSISSASIQGGFSGMRKWHNYEDLDSISVISSYGVRNRWVAGEASDTESITSSSNLTPLDSIPLCPLETTARIDSTDSGIAAEKDIEEDFDSHTPPPPPEIYLTDKNDKQDATVDNNVTEQIETQILLANPEESTKGSSRGEITIGTNIGKITKKNQQSSSIEAPALLRIEETNKASSHTAVKETTPTELTLVTAPVIEEIIPSKSLVVTPPPEINESSKTLPIPELELAEIDWQYQLPSPPKAFRDSSPIINDTNSVLSDCKDSVVTSPELFEKLKTLEDNYSEVDTFKSEATSIASEEPLNTLSLEHLEKRKSLVYNRELATSLKMTDSIENSNKSASFLNNSHNGEFQTKQPPKPAHSQTQTLPNFKITTYDVPKQNIKVFEDDTIRSNTLSRNNLSNSEERKEYKFYKPPSTNNNVSRSGSFSTDRTLMKPVSRSKSTLTLNKYPAGKRDDTNNISRSNSLFDVSGLHSLEVMKLIQNKLNTPPGSAENVNIYRPEPYQAQSYVPQKPQEPKSNYEKPLVEEKEVLSPTITSPEPIKKYYYRGPPSINMSTWSERPKIPVAVKEDEDYKLGNVSSKLIVNTTNNNVTSNNSVAVKSVQEQQQEQITQKSGNVVIKIGGNNNNNNNNYSKNLGPVGYRKPFSNVNQNNARPHSIALPSDFDISRVPVVRSVEYKKHYKDLNTSITHLNQGNDDFRSLHYCYDKSDSFAEKFRSTENLRNIEKQDSITNQRVFRVGGFKPNNIQQQPKPVVRGFKINNEISATNNRLSWNPPSTYNTLPSKPKLLEKDFGTNQHVPFSQNTLRRTESSKLYAKNAENNRTFQIKEANSYDSLPPNYSLKSKLQVASSTPPPPPPQMPKINIKLNQSINNNNNLDPRDMLLESIRNFGGKKGLKTVKA